VGRIPVVEESKSRFGGESMYIGGSVLLLILIILLLVYLF
jgi:hypothetical protein